MIRKTCKECGEEFTKETKVSRQVYCSPDCYVIARDRRAKERAKNKKDEEITFPALLCLFCGHETQLDFDPRGPNNFKKMEEIVCKKCGKRRGDLE